MPLEDPIKLITYSNRYSDENYEYRHVTLPKELARMVPRVHLMTESEWRNLGVQQSLGWVHYMIHQPASYITIQETKTGEPAHIIFILRNDKNLRSKFYVKPSSVT